MSSENNLKNNFKQSWIFEKCAERRWYTGILNVTIWNNGKLDYSCSVFMMQYFRLLTFIHFITLHYFQYINFLFSSVIANYNFEISVFKRRHLITTWIRPWKKRANIWEISIFCKRNFFFLITINRLIISNLYVFIWRLKDTYGTY